MFVTTSSCELIVSDEISISFDAVLISSLEIITVVPAITSNVPDLSPDNFPISAVIEELVAISICAPPFKIRCLMVILASLPSPIGVFLEYETRVSPLSIVSASSKSAPHS